MTDFVDNKDDVTIQQAMDPMIQDSDEEVEEKKLEIPDDFDFDKVYNILEDCLVLIDGFNEVESIESNDSNYSLLIKKFNNLFFENIYDIMFFLLPQLENSEKFKPYIVKLEDHFKKLSEQNGVNLEESSYEEKVSLLLEKIVKSVDINTSPDIIKSLKEEKIKKETIDLLAKNSNDWKEDLEESLFLEIESIDVNSKKYDFYLLFLIILQSAEIIDTKIPNKFEETEVIELSEKDFNNALRELIIFYISMSYNDSTFISKDEFKDEIESRNITGLILNFLKESNKENFEILYSTIFVKLEKILTGHFKYKSEYRKAMMMFVEKYGSLENFLAAMGGSEQS